MSHRKQMYKIRENEFCVTCLYIMYTTNYIFCCWYNEMGEKRCLQKDLMQYQNQRNVSEHDKSH